MGLTSRPGLVVQEVATWERCRDLAWGWTRERGRDMRPRPGHYAPDLHMLSATCAGCAHDMRATSLLCAKQRPQPGHCARSVRATWVVGCAHCAPNPVLIQCTVYSHCLDHCS